jgi:hypothetical protein
MPENEHGKSSGRLCERIYGCIRTLRGVIHMAKKQPPSKTEAQEAACWAKSQNLIADRFEQTKAAGKLGKGTVARVARERAGARLRGIEAKRKLLETEGDPLSSAQAAKLLKISRQGVDKRRRENKLLGLELGKKGYHYPSWQFDLRGLEQVLTALGGRDPWEKLSFFLNPSAILGDHTPLTALRGKKDNLTDIVNAAVSYGEQGG